MDINDKVAITLTRGQWTAILQLIWQKATCEAGMPLINAMQPQLEGNTEIKKAGNSRILSPADD